jgi:hypothetical protein
MSTNFVTNPVSADPMNPGVGEQIKYLRTNKENVLTGVRTAHNSQVYVKPFVINPSSPTANANLTSNALVNGCVVLAGTASTANCGITFNALSVIRSLREKIFVPIFSSNSTALNIQESTVFAWEVLFINHTGNSINLTSSGTGMVNETGSAIAINANAHRKIRFVIFNIDPINSNNNRIHFRPSN